MSLPTDEMHFSQDATHPRWQHVRALLGATLGPRKIPDAYDLARLAAVLPHLPEALKWQAAALLHRAWLRGRRQRQEITAVAARLARERFEMRAARRDPVLMDWIFSTLIGAFLTGVVGGVNLALARTIAWIPDAEAAMASPEATEEENKEGDKAHPSP